MNKKILFLILVSVFSISLFLRLYHLDLISLYADETAHYSRFISITNPAGGVLDLIYREVFQRTFSYTWLFGLTSFGARFGSALYGSLIPISIYFLATAVDKDKKKAFVASLLSAVLPSFFMVSRIGHTSVPLLVIFITLHAFFFLRSNHIRDYFISLIFLGLAIINYPSMVIIAPPVLLLVLFYLYKNISKKQRLYFLLITLPILIIFSGFLAKRFRLFDLGGRALDLAIWRDVNTPWEIDKFRALSWNSTPTIFSFGLPPETLANKLVYNRAMANVSIFTRNYLSFFSPDWLFLKGDPILRHSTGQAGAFYPFLLPFVLYGAFKFFQTTDRKKKLTFLIWILVSPIPAAITKDGAGYLLRVVTMLPFLTYFCALGIVESFNLIKKNWRWPYGLLLGLIGLYSAYYFFFGYFHVYPALSARAYEYGFEELSDFQVSHENKTMLIIWDGHYPLKHFLFWQKIPFADYDNMTAAPLVIGETTYWRTLPNLYFANVKQPSDLMPFIKQYKPAYVVLPDRYFVKYPEEIIELLTFEEEIKYPDQTTAFTIYKVSR